MLFLRRKAQWKAERRRRMPCGIVNGKPLTDKENLEHQQQQNTPPSQEQARREEHEQEGIRERAEALAHKLAQTYDELTRLLEQNPEVGRQVTDTTVKHEGVYRRLKQRLELANASPRCRWIRQDGTTCGSPQLRHHIYCFAHKQMMEARALALRLPAPEDANAIQVGLMRIQKALIEDTISTKKAGLLLYSMQLALTNVGQTTFGQAKDEELVQETVEEDEAISEKQTPTTETRRHGGERDLPLMNADDTDPNKRIDEDAGAESEFVHVPGGYGYTRVRLKIEPGLGGERRPVQAVIAPEDPAQVHANLG